MAQSHPKLTPKLVDAESIRNSSKEAQEFGLYATHNQMPDVVPEGHVFIDENCSDVDRYFFQINAEAYEAAIAQGQDDNEAYDYGLAVERAERERNPLEGKNRDGARPYHDEVFEGIYRDQKPWKTIRRDNEQIEIWIVNGLLVRDTEKTDFTQGGTAFAYPFIPEAEIWVEDTVSDDERPFIALHEFVERKLMKHEELGYDKSHEVASKLEYEARQKYKRAGQTKSLSRRRLNNLRLLRQKYRNRSPVSLPIQNSEMAWLDQEAGGIKKWITVNGAHVEVDASGKVRKGPKEALKKSLSNQDANYYKEIGGRRGAIKIGGGWVGVYDTSKVDISLLVGGSVIKWQGPPNAEITRALNNPAINTFEKGFGFGECFACGKPLKGTPKEVWTSDPQMQWVGPDCYRKIVSTGKQGYQPPKGGPRLYAAKPDTYLEKGLYNTVEAVGNKLGSLWAKLENRYGRKTALTMALGMLGTAVVPGNVMAIIAAAEAARGIRNYFTPKPKAPSAGESYFATCDRDSEGHCKSYAIKSEGGPCEAGERADLTGCIPAKDDDVNEYRTSKTKPATAKPKKAKAVTPKAEQLRDSIHSLFAKSLAKAAPPDPESQKQVKKYQETADKVLATYNEKTLQEFHDNLKVVRFFGSVYELNQKMYDAGMLPPNFKGAVLGFWELGSLNLDGELPKQARDSNTEGYAASTEQIYAHEFGHCIDDAKGKHGGKYSGTAEWKEIFRDEVDQYDITGHPMLSEYAKTSPGEAWGEIWRLLYVDKAKVRKDFPRSWDYLKQNGLVD